ncbi:MAG: hypothetical protein DMG35_05385 [Acidobacteria bacterium]|nr:MAG: hypothetical protein DMG35_05385 [Acidobacteriota bacterium]
MVGTRKGAFLFSSKDRKKWDIAGPCFSGQEVHRVAQDPRDPKRHYAAVNNAWFGPHLYASTDNGKKWEPSEKGLEVKGITGKTGQVTDKGMEMKEITDATLKRIWHIAPGAADEPSWYISAVTPACSSEAATTVPHGNWFWASAITPPAPGGIPVPEAWWFTPSNVWEKAG